MKYEKTPWDWRVIPDRTVNLMQALEKQSVPLPRAIIVKKSAVGRIWKWMQKIWH